MSNQSPNNYVEGVRATYAQNLKAAIQSQPYSWNNVSTADGMNARLRGTGLSLTRQAIHKFTDPNQIGKGGVSLHSFITIAVGLGYSKDPKIAAAMLSLELFGVWAKDEVPVKSMEQIVKGRFKTFQPTNSSEALLTALSRKLDIISEVLTEDTEYISEARKQKDPVLRFLWGKIEGQSLSDVRQAASEFGEGAERIVEIFSGTGPRMVSKDWPLVACTLSSLSGSVVRIEEIRSFVEGLFQEAEPKQLAIA